jgi:hypothetical protein
MLSKEQKIEKLKKIAQMADKINSVGNVFIAKKFDDIEENISSLDSTLADYIENIPIPKEGEKGEKGDQGERGEQGLHGMKGDKGDKGDRGEKGEKGDDGFGIDGKDGKDGVNGKDGSPDTPEEIVVKLNTLEKVLDRKVIKGLETFVDQSNLDRAISILDQRTQFLLSKRTAPDPVATAWGTITGTLSDQTDLQAALDAKGTVTSVAALTLGTTGTDLSSTVATGTTTPVITLNVPTASALNRGALSSTDWSTFNSKFNLPSLTAGSVLFSNGTTIAQDNANFFWDDTNNRLGIGTISPSEKLDVRGNGIFGTTNKVWIIPDYAGSGEIAAGASIGGTGTGGFSIFPNYFGTSGTKFSLGYYNQSVWFSGLELANVSGGFGKLLLMKSGGNVGIGTTTPQATLQVLTTVTDIAGRFSTNQSNRFLIMSGSTHNALVAFGKEGISTLWAIGNEHSTGDTLKITPRGDLVGTASLGILKSNSNIGLSVITPTATLHIRAGTATAGTAPVKFTTGTNLTTAEAGAMEYNNTFHVTNSDATRRHIATAPNTTKVTAAAPYTNDGYIIINIGGTDFKVMTTA